jgi:hypothetical protein
MPSDIRKFLELRKKLRQSADELSDSLKFTGNTKNADSVEKVRHMIRATLEATEQKKEVFVDVISIKSFLASIRKIGLK